MVPVVSDEVADALSSGSPIVALESTVFAHGLPYPQSVETAVSCEAAVRGSGAIPATIAVLGGELRVGLTPDEIEKLATLAKIKKISRRDLPAAVGLKQDCATTVATTMFIAHRAGIRVFATGGIGGVHRGFDADISADLPELAQTPITVISSGAKIVLDLPRTREWLETHGVTVLGWRCVQMPAFYSRASGLPVDESVQEAAAAADIIHARDRLSLPSAILLTVPVPESDELPLNEVELILADALKAADAGKVSGKEVTPFLLSYLSEHSGGRTLAANIALLKNNASVAALVACALSK